MHHLEPWENFKKLKVKIQDSMRKTNLFLGNASHVPTSRRSSKNTRKLNSQSVLNIELFQNFTKMKLVVLGVAKKLVRDVVHLK
jgi:hypothetical protein